MFLSLLDFRTANSTSLAHKFCGTRSLSHASVVQPSVAVLSRSRLRTFGTIYHQVWHHRRVLLFLSLAWKQSCPRDAIVLYLYDLDLGLLSTFFTYSLMAVAQSYFSSEILFSYSFYIVFAWSFLFLFLLLLFFINHSSFYLVLLQSF